MTKHTLTMDKIDIQLIVRALIKYKPSEDEAILISMVNRTNTKTRSLITWLEHYLEHTEEL